MTTPQGSIFALRRAGSGKWSVFDVATCKLAVIDGIATTGLTMMEADKLASTLNTKPT
ncbi:hypothetical protein QTA58_00110 [Neorhizobium sp. CSC1952]|uniref:hypothetical protein n=1 Tax=Neorhizobium sp. CSC1952 TaxID=2978974 RepID=UPI0025A55D41|nr:hypothetical protein [Rhizobium sp. CSC1952]WJR67183.1 hypothetical protein QTA58_23890 [Rhizobium sp. CSC1952]WJR67212.1 hypothetical protein QTA58_00110 [Rhizobium sp. CSC1952]